MQPILSEDTVSGGGLKEFFLGIFAIFAPAPPDVPPSIVNPGLAIAPPPGVGARAYVPGMVLSSYEMPTVNVYSRFPERTGAPFPTELGWNSFTELFQEIEFEISQLDDWKFRLALLDEHREIIYKILYDVSRESITPNPTFREVNTRQLKIHYGSHSGKRALLVNWKNLGEDTTTFGPTKYALNLSGRCAVIQISYEEFRSKFPMLVGVEYDVPPNVVAYDVPLEYVNGYPIVYLVEYPNMNREGRTSTIVLPANLYSPKSVVKRFLGVSNIGS
jgi:hypothetical protein